MKNKNVTFMTHAAIIAAVYVILGVIFGAVGKDFLQIRFAEALTILPIFTPAAVPGLFIGCLISNILSGCILPDIIFGSLATLAGACGTRLFGKIKPLWGILPPIIINTIIVPLILRYGYSQPLPLSYMMLTVGIGELISCGILGLLLYNILKPASLQLFGNFK